MSGRTGFPPEVVKGIMLRDGGRCAMEGAEGCPGGEASVTDPGHRLNRGVGGDPRDFVNDAANGSAQHNRCNFRLEHDAVFAEEGRRRGAKIDHSGDDRAAIEGTPMWSPFFGQWVRLLAAGCYLTGVTDPGLDAREADLWLPVGVVS